MRVIKNSYSFLLNLLINSRLKKIATLEGNLEKRKGAAKATEFSPPRFNRIFEIFVSSGNGTSSLGSLGSIFILMSSIKDISRSIESLDRNPQSPKKTANIGFFIELENYATFLGANSLGYTDVPRDLIFKDLSIQHQNAIVITLKIDNYLYDGVPRRKIGALIHQTYNKLGRISIKMAEFLRENGYSAQPDHPIMGQVSFPPLAQKASLGWQGKNRLLITPESGPSVLLSAVYTSIKNLPKPPQNKHGWIEDYCETCKACIRECPSGAISGTSIYHKDGMIDATGPGRCFRIITKHRDCNLCINRCPFSREDYQKLKNNFHSTKSK